MYALWRGCACEFTFFNVRKKGIAIRIMEANETLGIVGLRPNDNQASNIFIRNERSNYWIGNKYFNFIRIL